jgi:hypothetical protein
MRKSLTTICAALLVTGLAACNRGGDNASDEARLNKAAGMLDENIDTSADDMTANAADLDAGETPANAASGNAAVPAGNAAASNRTAGNAQ